MCIRWLPLVANAIQHLSKVRRSLFLNHQHSSNDETFLTLSFGVEDKPNNNNFNNFLSETIHSITKMLITFAMTVTNVCSGPMLNCIALSSRVT
jgi:hypothetical protein